MKNGAEVRRLPWASWATCVATAYGLKAAYSRSSVEDLGWILAPTARLVGVLRGEHLTAGVSGWAPPDGSYVIAPACAGVNFLILAFVVSMLGFSHRFRSMRGRLLFWLGALIGAWTITLAVNTVRILAAIELRRGSIFGLDPGQSHRLLGVVVYLGALWVIFAALDRLTRRENADRRASAAALLLVPGAYLAMTLAVPILTGAFRAEGPRFAEHAIMVLGATLAALGVALVGWRWVDRIEGRP